MAILTSNGSREDVQAKIDAATNGDIVTLPSGVFTWTTPVTVSGKAIKIRGEGADRVLARSTTSIAVGTGTKVFTLITETLDEIEELKAELTNGATVRIYRAGGELDANVGGNGLTGNLPWMEGTITSLSGTTLTMNITSTNYSGTHDVWIITRKPTTTVVVNVATGNGGLSITESVDGNVDVSRIHFAQDSSSTGDLTYLVKIDPTSGGEPVLIRHCSFLPVYGKAVQAIRHGSNRGVIRDCTFNHLPGSHGSQNGVYHHANAAVDSWSTASTMGAADTTGKSNLYVEACDFHYNNDVVDASENSRIVIRECLFNNSGIGAHGPDTDNWGARHYEVYDNVFTFNQNGSAAYNIQGFLIPRGGTGVFTGNTVDDIVSFGAWGDKSEVLLQIQMLTRLAGPNPVWGSNNDTSITSISVDNPTVVTSTNHGMITGDYVRISGSNSTPSIDGYRQITRLTDDTYTVAVNVTGAGSAGKSNRVDYPCPRQIGLGYVTGLGQDGLGNSTDSVGYVGDSEPLYVWDNDGTWNGVVVVDGTDNGQATDPDINEDYVKAGRDFFSDGTSKPGWARFTYPHPLSSGETILTTDGSRADVQAKIDLANPGDVVSLPAGSFTWTSGVTCTKGITIRGQGAGRVIGTSTTSVSVGTGTKVFTVELDETSQEAYAILPGEQITVYRTGGEVVGPSGVLSGQTPWMSGTVLSFVGDVLTLNVTATNHSGTHDLWFFATAASTTIDHNFNGTLITCVEPSSGTLEIEGIKFIHNSALSASDLGPRFVRVHGDSNGTPVLIHDNFFLLTKYTACVTFNETNRGVIWNSSFVALPFAQGPLAIQHVNNSLGSVWEGPSTMGTSDLTGESNLYVESCDFHGWLNATDFDSNSKSVFRNCLMDHAAIGSHGFDSSAYGLRHYEIYDNKWLYSGRSNGTTLPVPWKILLRGGTGVICDNEIPSSFGSDYGAQSSLNIGVWKLGHINSAVWGNTAVNILGATANNPTVITTTTGHGLTSGDFTRISGSNTTPSIDGKHQVTVLSPTTFSIPVNVSGAGTSGLSNRVDYPAPRQLGHGYVTGDGVDGLGNTEAGGVYVGDLEPLYIWDNTPQPPTLALHNGGNTYSNQDLIEDYLIEGRDYILGVAKPGYTKYEFPHPLRTEDSTPPEPTQVEAPIFSPSGGTFSAAQSVTISTPSVGATIRYTTNGTNPTNSSGTIYSSPVSISSTTTLKAIAYDGVLLDSDVTSQVYTFVQPTVATPQFSPSPGVYQNSVTVSISSTTPSVTIRYTTNGTTPSSSNGTVYSAPIVISTTTTLKAIAYRSGYQDSSVLSGTYTIKAKKPNVGVGHGPGKKKTITLSSATLGAAIYYTLDGTTPTDESTEYDEPFEISSTKTISAIAYGEGLEPSDVRVSLVQVVLSTCGRTPCPPTLPEPVEQTIFNGPYSYNCFTEDPTDPDPEEFCNEEQVVVLPCPEGSITDDIVVTIPPCTYTAASVEEANAEALAAAEAEADELREETPCLYENEEQECCDECPEGTTGEPICVTIDAADERFTDTSVELANAAALAQACADAALLREGTPCTEQAEDAEVQLMVASRSGTATLVGCDEFIVSSPPRFYRKAVFSGTSSSFWSGSFVDNCDNVIPLDVAIYDDITRQYDSLTGAVTFSGQTIFNGTPTPATSLSCEAGPDQNCSGDVPFGEGDITTWVIDSATSATRTDNPEFCCVRRTELGSVLYSIEYSGSATKILSEEDTEDDAITRFRNANSYPAPSLCASFTVPNLTPLNCGPSSRELRVSGRTFDFQESENTLTISNLVPSQDYDVRVEITRTDLDTMVSELAAYYEFTDTADGSGEINDTFDTPNVAGYSHKITNIEVFPA